MGLVGKDSTYVREKLFRMRIFEPALCCPCHGCAKRGDEDHITGGLFKNISEALLQECHLGRRVLGIRLLINSKASVFLFYFLLLLLLLPGGASGLIS